MKLAALPGDGVGPEVVGEALRVLGATVQAFGVAAEVERLPYGAEHYLATGVALPPGEVRRLGDEFDVILVGALGDPRVPGGEHARDILLALRFELDLYVNERPARLLHERVTPLKGKAARDVDLVIFRENTEGLYLSIGGAFKRGTPDEIAVAEELHTRKGVERIVRHAFAWAAARGKGRMTMADKANAIPAHDLWRRVFREVGEEYPGIASDARYVDTVAMELVRAPEQFEVIVTGNLFGDILSDVAAAVVGGLGVAPSANRHPGRRAALFEPVHGSAPALVGRNVANPMAAILSLAMALEHAGAGEAAAAVEEAVRAAVAEQVTTPDLGGSYGTRAVGAWIAERLRRGGGG